MNLEIIILSEVSQTEKDKYDTTCMWELEKNKRYKSTYLQNRNRLTNIEKQTGSKQEKEYVKAIYCHPVYLTSMQSTS